MNPIRLGGIAHLTTAVRIVLLQFVADCDVVNLGLSARQAPAVAA